MKLEELNPIQLANAKLINAELVKIGLTNSFFRAGILAVVSKESGFMPVHEASYKGTPAARIRKIFSGILKNWTDVQIDNLKSNDEAFFNTVYHRADLGNTAAGDGWKYRGRGFNQLTGRANYQNIGNAIGVDIVNNPNILDTPEVGAKALAYFFRSSLVAGQQLGLFTKRYGIVKSSEINSIELGATVAHQCNMGWKFQPKDDTTGGYAHTKANAPSYLALTKV